VLSWARHHRLARTMSGGPQAREISHPPTAAVLLIGNELLSGKVRDENGYFLAKTLRRRGIRLVESCTVPDEMEAIGRALLRLVASVEFVFTSGGVGPTHDDVTLTAIAHATERPLRRSSEMEAIVRAHFGASITPAALHMADVPEGTSLRALPGWPVLRLDLPVSGPPRLAHDARVYILPGLPDLLRAKVDALEALPDELPSSAGWSHVVLHTRQDEAHITANLNLIVAAFPHVEIGSYPSWVADERGRLTCHVRIIFEAPLEHAGHANSARAALAELIGEGVPSDDSEPRTRP